EQAMIDSISTVCRREHLFWFYSEVSQSQRGGAYNNHPDFVALFLPAVGWWPHHGSNYLINSYNIQCCYYIMAL
ncbi:hypothetical protein, partial [Leclercia sp.]|uniref:hypothetical protein n=1 Tax=Leclercia sp. TaxID=1898428 RepID=UPI0028BF48C9